MRLEERVGAVERHLERIAARIDPMGRPAEVPESGARETGVCVMGIQPVSAPCHRAVPALSMASMPASRAIRKSTESTTFRSRARRRARCSMAGGYPCAQHAGEFACGAAVGLCLLLEVHGAETRNPGSWFPL